MFRILLKLEILISDIFFNIIHALSQFFVLNLSDTLPFSKSFPKFIKYWVALALIKNSVFKNGNT